MDTLTRLRNLGYEVTASGDRLKCRWTGPGDPPEEARSLLSELSHHKGEALDFLRSEADRPPVDPARRGRSPSIAGPWGRRFGFARTPGANPYPGRPTR